MEVNGQIGRYREMIDDRQEDKTDRWQIYWKERKSFKRRPTFNVSMLLLDSIISLTKNRSSEIESSVFIRKLKRCWGDSLNSKELVSPS